MDELQWAMQELRSALRDLSLDAEGQIGTLLTGPKFDPEDDLFNTDELALNLEDWIGMVPQLVAASLLSDACAQRIDRVWTQLGEMTGQQRAELWTIRGLRREPEWEKVRQLAKEALELM